MEKKFQLILFVGFLCFSVGESNSTVAPTAMETTETTTAFSAGDQTMNVTSSTQQPAPSVIIGLRVAVRSFIDLTSNSAEMELLVRQIEKLILPTNRETTSITVRNIKRNFDNDCYAR